MSAAPWRARTIHLSRGDWHIKVVANGELTCDATDFHVRTDLTAYQGTRSSSNASGSSVRHAT